MNGTLMYGWTDVFAEDGLSRGSSYLTTAHNVFEGFVVFWGRQGRGYDKVYGALMHGYCTRIMYIKLYMCSHIHARCVHIWMCVVYVTYAEFVQYVSDVLKCHVYI